MLKRRGAHSNSRADASTTAELDTNPFVSKVPSEEFLPSLFNSNREVSINNNNNGGCRASGGGNSSRGPQNFCSSVFSGVSYAGQFSGVIDSAGRGVSANNSMTSNPLDNALHPIPTLKNANLHTPLLSAPRGNKAGFFQQLWCGLRKWKPAQKHRLNARVTDSSSKVNINVDEGGNDNVFFAGTTVIGSSTARRPRHLARFCLWFILLLGPLYGIGWCVVSWWLEQPPLPPWDAAQAVVVQHEGAVKRMQLSVSRKVSLEELPSWTLRVVPRDCVDCVEGPAWGTAVRRAAVGIAGVGIRHFNDDLHDKHQMQGNGGVNGRDGADTQNNYVLTQGDILREMGARAIVASKGNYAVFATSAAPLGRIGPFLLAIRSVTDEVGLSRELPQWSWLKRTAMHRGESFLSSYSTDVNHNPQERGMKRRAGGTNHGAAEAKPASSFPSSSSASMYVAVMGIPTVDDSVHEQLRETQRATWMRYSAVARHENDFTGALLPLYVFAAREPRSADVAADPTRVPQDEDVGLTVDAYAFLPTMREFSDATELYKAWDSKNKKHRNRFSDDNNAKATVPVHGKKTYVQRRMSLRPDWRINEVWTSPCSHISSSTVYDHPAVVAVAGARATEHTPPMVLLSDYLDLPITPAFTSGAQYLCVASAALWLEALTYKNALWVDMLTDRRPTSEKRPGEDGGWGLPVEVGMTQKLILWLSYAYHAFPDVPYIIKGDDDVYVKVPQLVSDMWYVHGGQKSRDRMSDKLNSTNSISNGANAVENGRALRAEEDVAELKGNDAHVRQLSYLVLPSSPTLSSECVYWGLLWGQNEGTPYFVGMLYLVDRRLARVILEPPLELAKWAIPTVSLAAALSSTGSTSTSSITNINKASATVDLVRLAMLDFSPRLRAYYVATGMDEEDRFVGKTLNARHLRAQALCPNRHVTYVEEGSPRFHDLRRGYRSVITWASTVVHRCTPADMRFLDYFFHHEHSVKVATRTTATQAEEAAQMSGLLWVRSHLDSRFAGWEQLQPVQWVAHGSAEKNRKKGVVALEDGVAVYDVTFRPWQFEHLVSGGLMSVPHYKKKGEKYVLLE